MSPVSQTNEWDDENVKCGFKNVSTCLLSLP